MSFTGKSTYAAGAALPEIAEDIADLVSIVSPYETPLLDALGDPLRAAASTRHEWLEDSLLPNLARVNQPSLEDSSTNTVTFTLAEAGVVRVGDLLKPEGSREVLLVTAVSGADITVTRGYGGTVKAIINNAQGLSVLGNAALEGDDAGAPRFTTRVRKSNFTQIFSAAVQVSGTEAAVRQAAVEDEMDYQKQSRLRELLRDLENTVINGVAPTTTPEGSATVRRTMRGIIGSLTTNVFAPGVSDFLSDGALSEDQLNMALRNIWLRGSAKVDTIVVGGMQKRRINGFIAASQRFASSAEAFKNLVSSYESDFGVCRIVLSRYVPADSVLLLDSTRLAVLPLAGRSFQFRPLAATGDYLSGELLGEYTLELRNESAHGLIRGLSTTA